MGRLPVRGPRRIGAGVRSLERLGLLRPVRGGRSPGVRSRCGGLAVPVLRRAAAHGQSQQQRTRRSGHVRRPASADGLSTVRTMSIAREDVPRASTTNIHLSVHRHPLRTPVTLDCLTRSASAPSRPRANCHHASRFPRMGAERTASPSAEQPLVVDQPAPSRRGKRMRRTPNSSSVPWGAPWARPTWQPSSDTSARPGRRDDPASRITAVAESTLCLRRRRSGRRFDFCSFGIRA